MKIETVRIDSLILDDKNARKHSERNLKAIANSLSRFGQRKPIAVQGSKVLAGNGTLEAARSLGWTEIAIVKVPDDWDKETAKAYALADNRTAELAEWDELELAKQLLELEEAQWDITEIGFEKNAYASLNEWEEALQNSIKEQSEYRQWAFSLSNRQFSIVENAIKKAKQQLLDDSDNVNKNANALAEICNYYNER